VTLTRPPRTTLNTTVAKAVHLVIDGDLAWGSVERPNAATMGRSGWGHFRLAVYPPGTNPAERRAMTFARRWPYVGIVVALLIAIATSADWGFALGALVFVCGLTVTRHATRRVRSQTRRLHVAITVVGGSREVYGDAALFSKTVDAFALLDAQLRAGSLTPAQYEARWAELYEGLPTATPTRASARL
jgi:hypothetical protein